jgi:hypothetical protein
MATVSRRGFFAKLAAAVGLVVAAPAVLEPPEWELAADDQTWIPVWTPEPDDPELESYRRMVAAGAFDDWGH